MDDQGTVLTHITALDKRMTDGFEAINARLSDQAQAVNGRLDDLGQRITARTPIKTHYIVLNTVKGLSNGR